MCLAPSTLHVLVHIILTTMRNRLTITILESRKLRQRGVKEGGKGHTAGKGQDHDLNLFRECSCPYSSEAAASHVSGPTFNTTFSGVPCSAHLKQVPLVVLHLSSLFTPFIALTTN